MASSGNPASDAWRVYLILRSLMRRHLKQQGVKVVKKENVVSLFNATQRFSVSSGGLLVCGLVFVADASGGHNKGRLGF